MLIKNERVLTALAIMLDIAFHGGREGVVSGSDIAARGGLQRRGIEPILQSLARCGLLSSVRGPRGGYRLARSARLITLENIADCVSTQTPLSRPRQDSLFQVVMVPVWEGLNDSVKKLLATTTLDDMVIKARKAGLKPATEEPIAFVI
ncbi:Rrf2 family transcriptional regulator [Formicincola oecophyllae]|uniref:Rrf2 family transcriptional regulator n=1 Tax=Formicincola oecophyllae TaxID=2558361 RepID=A0A4Y6U8C8_9PROT|nr:Rrf2 family transcriptional regulator [Formicincola oecophyllae]QDH13434.1 Rrf2 family transcriptional regulator [Formicincola oecophyllae]